MDSSSPRAPNGVGIIKNSHQRHVKRKRSTVFSKIIAVFALCCLASLLVSFFHGVAFMGGTTNSGFGLLDTGQGIQRPVLPSDLRIADLDCHKYGGPSDPSEMVYWEEIESDSRYVSPFLDASQERFMTFEPDGGGFNNIRMAMETVLAMAHAMGRTLVLPPEQQMYLLTKGGDKQRKDFSFNDFFPMQAISAEQDGLNIITMEEFLERVALNGRLKDSKGNVAFPPGNRTNWNGDTEAVRRELAPWLQSISFLPEWKPDQCLVAFPRTRGTQAIEALHQILDDIQRSGGFPPTEHFVGNPTPVDALAIERLKENNRKRTLCIYNETLQQQHLIHFHGKGSLGARLLVHFYAFLFFEDWRQDLWTKRFIRDHVRYNDEIQCAAARIVKEVRKRARQRDSTNKQGIYDAFHIRRGDFQYKKTRLSAKEIYEISKNEIADGTTVYIATDERKKEFFKDMAVHYDLIFLDDFKHLLEGINTNFYGMIDQLVASRSRVFFGCWFSTFTGYINRIRGYHADRHKLPGHEKGIIESYFYAIPENKMRMKDYWPLTGAFYSREFPVSWRDINKGIGNMSIG